MTPWYINAPNAVQWFDMKYPISLAVEGAATVSAKLVDPADNNDVAGSTFSLPVVNAGTGHYGGYSPILASLPLNKTYRLKITAVKDSAVIGDREFDVVTARHGPN